MSAKFYVLLGMYTADCQPLVDFPEVTMKILSHMYSGKDVASLLCTCHAFGTSLKDFAHSQLKVQNRLLQHWKRRSIEALPQPVDVLVRHSEWCEEFGGACMAGKMRIRFSN